MRKTSRPTMMKPEDRCRVIRCFSAVHQEKATRPTMSQWNRRVAPSQTFCFEGFAGLGAGAVKGGFPSWVRQQRSPSLWRHARNRQTCRQLEAAATLARTHEYDALWLETGALVWTIDVRLNSP